jgi:hypothetical protein
MGPPHRKQRDIVNYIFKPDTDTVKQVDVSCGRGFGKSMVAIDIAVRALNIDGNQVGLFLEPDVPRMNKVFLKKWRAHVPPECYKINKSERRIEWWNGSMLFYGSRNVSGSMQQMEDSQLGADLTFVIDDEAALKCSYNFYVNTLATIREPSTVRFYLTISTPRVGAFKRLVTSPGHKLFMGQSSDNVYLPKGYVENLRMNMSKQQARRELDGEFVSLEGKIWPDFDSEKPWPEGNIHYQHTGFDPGRPWWLFCDLGSANGAFAVVQQTDATLAGQEVFGGSVWVVVADLCPYKNANAARAFQILKANFGTPAMVVAGADVNTRASTDGKTIAYFARQTWSNVNVHPVSERTYDRQLQYDRMLYLVCSARNERRLCVAKDFVSLDVDSKRGVREMFEEDSFGEKPMPEGQLLPKGPDHPVNHIRDAMLMGTVAVMSIPDWNYSENVSNYDN